MGKTTYDSIADALKTIATKLSATIPSKKYSTKKDEIADTLDAISDTDLGGGGGGSDVFAIKWVSGDVLDKTAGEIVAAIEAGKRLVAYQSSFNQHESLYNEYQVSVTHYQQDDSYEFSATLYYGIGESATFTASSVDAYPAYVSG